MDRSESGDRVHKLRILVVGSLPPPIGGTTVSLKHLVAELSVQADVALSVLDTRGARDKSLGSLMRAAGLPFRLLGHIRRSDVVSVHCCTSALPTLGLMALVLTRLSRKPIVIRKFAGTDHRESGPLRGAISEYVLKSSDVYLAQTHELVDQAKARGLHNVRWFPTHRPYSGSDSERPADELAAGCSRFVYVGHVRECKGIGVLSEAAKSLPAGVSVDVYGPWFDDLDKDLFQNSPNVRYCGVLAPEDVIPTMRQYDAFVFPTHHTGEGYPGCILEAYSAGLPVVTTRWMAIPELVDEKVGILVAPKDAKALCSAMARLHSDEVLFRRLRANTHEKARFFSVQHWTREFVDCCSAVVASRPRRDT